ncbi:MAG TPA: hypothetical protein VMX75_05680 [Spirochaetia bacterium]|nr:hypothetical protein [Spirochaetia bacterium]
MKDLLQGGMDKLQQGLVSDGIKQLASVLAEGQTLSKPLPEADVMTRRVETELSKIEAAIEMEADTVWLDSNLNQTTASTLELTLIPTIRLALRGETGRSIISNAPIEFEFVKGSGTLTSYVNTNEYGQASCPLAGFDNPQAENIIRAGLIYRLGNYTYRFKNIYRDFIYVPPSRRATVLVLERSKDWISPDPLILNPVLDKLKELDFDFALYNGILSPSDFMQVYAGEADAVSRLQLNEGMSYLVVVLNDCFDVRQLEVGGKKLNLYVSDARATIRIIRTADGKIMFQTSVEQTKSRGSHGQGGNRDVAVLDALTRTSEAMSRTLEAAFPQIKRIMTGGMD